MTLIQDQKLLYHLTALNNFASILQHGLLPRRQLQQAALTTNIADPDILERRQAHDLDNMVPFHWFARNPFDGRVEEDRPNEIFVLITVERTFARQHGWRISPRHPLAHEAPTLLEYDAGFAAINWDIMNQRKYHDEDCKSICMAECLSPTTVQPADFSMIFVSNHHVEQVVTPLLRQHRLTKPVRVNERMFYLNGL